MQSEVSPRVLKGFQDAFLTVHYENILDKAQKEDFFFFFIIKQELIRHCYSFIYYLYTDSKWLYLNMIIFFFNLFLICFFWIFIFFLLTQREHPDFYNVVFHFDKGLRFTWLNVHN